MKNKIHKARQTEQQTMADEPESLQGTTAGRMGGTPANLRNFGRERNRQGRITRLHGECDEEHRRRINRLLI